MTALMTDVDPGDQGSVVFVPPPESVPDGVRARAEVLDGPLLRRILAQLQPELTDLVRRTRRVGPATTGTALLVAGCRRGAGTSTIAMALAAAASRENPVLLIDRDQTNPEAVSLGSIAEPTPEYEGSQSAALLRASIPYLDSDRRIAFLTAHAALATDSPGALEGSPADRLLRLRKTFPLIIVDGGSIWESGAAWARWMDVALVVCDSGLTLADDWARAWDRLEEEGTHVLGIVETFAE